ncbi:fimbrial protein [Pseudocitrobacter corydidari]
MKMTKIALSAALAFGMFSSAHAVQGNYGKVHLWGEITESPCDMAPSEINKDVPMGQVSSSNLNQGIKSGMTSFKLVLTNCNSATLTTTKTSFTGETGPTGVANSFAVKQAGVNMADVGIILTDMQSSSVVENAPVIKPGVSVDQVWTPFNGDHDLLFGAYLLGTTNGTAGEGAFSSDVNFSIQYQ